MSPDVLTNCILQTSELQIRVPWFLSSRNGSKESMMNVVAEETPIVWLGGGCWVSIPTKH